MANPFSGEADSLRMPHVLDATAIRNGLSVQDKSEFFTTPSVVREVSRGKAGRDLALAIEVSITVKSPGGAASARVAEAAARTGDAGRLSDTDRDVLALALELEATLVSDDYSVQNVAAVLKIPVQGNLAGIREVFTWTYRCRGCGRYFEEKQVDCPVCGSEVRTVRKKN